VDRRVGGKGYLEDQKLLRRDGTPRLWEESVEKKGLLRGEIRRKIRGWNSFPNGKSRLRGSQLRKEKYKAERISQWERGRPVSLIEGKGKGRI